MTNPDYGSIEFYENMFADILADVGTDDSSANKIAATNILIAFERAIKSWADYHFSAAESYKKLLKDFKETKLS